MDVNRRSFYGLLVNTLIANVTTSFLWFALVFWIYLETRSVLATALLGGTYMLLVAVMGVPFGTWIDHWRKKQVIVVATAVTAVAFAASLGFFLLVPTDQILTVGSLAFWVFGALVLIGAVVESARGITLSTCVTLLVPEAERPNMNGLVGMVNGLGFAITSVFSGLAVGQLGMLPSIMIAVGLTVASLLHLFTVSIPEPEILHSEDVPRAVDFGGAFRAVRAVPGLTGLVLFAALNNLLGGAFMALMDPYGLTLVSVEVWGLLWGVLSFGFMIGSLWVAKKGLGVKPLRTLLLANVAMWLIAGLFTIRESIWLLAGGILLYMALIPVAEAAEQTVLQKVVPYAKQGRVFGLAQAVEVAAAPLSTFLVGPIAEFWIIPYMKSDVGQRQFDWLVGQGQARGIALVFVLTGIVGIGLTAAAFASRSYRWLTLRYAEPEPEPEGEQVAADR
jgi:MFS transporter, DHA3 family, multidrug efflux protein